MKRPAMLNIDIDTAVYHLEQVREDLERYDLNNKPGEWLDFDMDLDAMIGKCNKMKEIDVGDDW